VSTLRYCRDGLAVNTYAGPAEHHSPNTNSRAMVQITSWGSWLGLTMDHWVDLVCFIRSLDQRQIGILSAPEVTGGEPQP
jgi:hypothetical protein